MIRFQLVSLEGLKFDEEVYEVLVPTQEGTIAALSLHMPLVSVAAPGIISIRRQATDSNEQMDHFSTMGGLIEIDGQTVRFLADEISEGGEVSEHEAAEALERAEKLVAGAKDKLELEQAQQQLARAGLNLNIAKLKKRRH